MFQSYLLYGTAAQILFILIYKYIENYVVVVEKSDPDDLNNAEQTLNQFDIKNYQFEDRYTFKEFIGKNK